MARQVSMLFGNASKAVSDSIQNSPTYLSDYSTLTNKPQIESVVLNGNISLSELGIRNIYYDTKQNWDAQSSLVSKAGAIYIYSDCQVDYDQDGTAETIAGVKVGDGSAYVIDLPFITDPLGDALIDHINDGTRHITSAERTAWNNKVSAFIASGNPEELVLSKVLYELNGLIIST